MRRLVKLVMYTAVAISLQCGANACALAERGYEAVGGEVLIFPFLMAFGYAVGLFDSESEDEDEEETEM